MYESPRLGALLFVLILSFGPAHTSAETNTSLVYSISGLSHYWNSNATLVFTGTDSFNITDHQNGTLTVEEDVVGRVRWPYAVFYQTHYTNGDHTVRVEYGNVTNWKVHNVYRIQDTVVTLTSGDGFPRVEFYPIFSFGWQSNAWVSPLWHGYRQWLILDDKSLSAKDIPVQAWLGKYETSGFDVSAAPVQVRIENKTSRAVSGGIDFSYLFPGRIDEVWKVHCQFYWDAGNGILLYWRRDGQTVQGSHHEFVYTLIGRGS